MTAKMVYRRSSLCHMGVHHRLVFASHRLHAPHWTAGNVPPPLRRDWPSVPRSACDGLKGTPSWASRGVSRWADGSCANGLRACSTTVLPASLPKRDAGVSPLFPPEVAVPRVKSACERPAMLGRSLSQGDGRALARPRQREGLVEPIAAETVRRLRDPHQRKPWRHHPWRAPTTPREAAF